MGVGIGRAVVGAVGAAAVARGAPAVGYGRSYAPSTIQLLEDEWSIDTNLGE